MTLVAYLENVSLTDSLLLVALVGAGVKTLLEATGRTRSSKILRQENRDLIDRNKTLEVDKAERIAEELILRARIEALELKVRDLEGRDLAAVLQALSDHEVRAQMRADSAESSAETRHKQALASWERIAAAVEAQK